MCEGSTDFRNIASSVSLCLVESYCRSNRLSICGCKMGIPRTSTRLCFSDVHLEVRHLDFGVSYLVGLAYADNIAIITQGLITIVYCTRKCRTIFSKLQVFVGGGGCSGCWYVLPERRCREHLYSSLIAIFWRWFFNRMVTTSDN